jgi:hypothetical protein
MRTMRTLVLALSLVSSLVACKKKNEQPAATGSAAAPAAEAPKPFDGNLTVGLVSKGRDIQVYTNAFAKAKTMLGEPTRVDGTKYQWAAIESDTCAYYTLEDAGGNAKSPGVTTVPKTDPECLAATGKAPAAGSDTAGSAGSGAAGSGSAGSAAAGSAAAGSAKK